MNTTPRKVSAFMAELFGEGKPAVVDYEDVPTRVEHHMVKEYFDSQGCPTVVCDPRHLGYEAGRLHLDGRQIDIVYCNSIRSLMTVGIAAILAGVPRVWYVKGEIGRAHV